MARIFNLHHSFCHAGKIDALRSTGVTTLHIFWDIENCALPSKGDVRSHVQQVRDVLIQGLRSACAPSSFPCTCGALSEAAVARSDLSVEEATFTAFFQERQLSLAQQRQLEEAGVTLQPVPNAGRKMEQVDFVLLRHVQDLLMSARDDADRNHVTFVIISMDNDFNPWFKHAQHETLLHVLPVMMRKNGVQGMAEELALGTTLVLPYPTDSEARGLVAAAGERRGAAVEEHPADAAMERAGRAITVAEAFVLDPGTACWQPPLPYGQPPPRNPPRVPPAVPVAAPVPAELQQLVCMLLLLCEGYSLPLVKLHAAFATLHRTPLDLSPWHAEQDPLRAMLHSMRGKVALVPGHDGVRVELRDWPAPPSPALQAAVKATVDQCHQLPLYSFPKAFQVVTGQELRWGEWGSLVNLLLAMPRVCRLDTARDGERWVSPMWV